jgi:NTE family protein
MKTAVARLQPRNAPSRKPIGLALQGGGSWGAYTWGVLDSLLASRSVAIAQLSGTSAGAINAAIVASALAKGSPARAREALRAFWMQIALPASHDIGREVWGPVERKWRESMGAWLMSTGALSPYNTNPLGINPLRDAITAHVDIEAIRSKSAPALFVTVTNVKTGLPRVIANDAMTIDAVLASACLPQLFQAVEIDGEPYWDGGYSGNPTITPLVRECDSRDTILVQINPVERPGTPRTARDILNRLNEVSFNAVLLKELRMIALLRQVASPGDCEGASWAGMRIHRIASEQMTELGYSSKLNAEWDFLCMLRDEGRRAAEAFLVAHSQDLGRRSSFDLDQLLEVV